MPQSLLLLTAKGVGWASSSSSTSPVAVMNCTSEGAPIPPERMKEKWRVERWSDRRPVAACGETIGWTEVRPFSSTAKSGDFKTKWETFLQWRSKIMSHRLTTQLIVNYSLRIYKCRLYRIHTKVEDVLNSGARQSLGHVKTKWETFLQWKIIIKKIIIQKKKNYYYSNYLLKEFAFYSNNNTNYSSLLTFFSQTMAQIIVSQVKRLLQIKPNDK